MSFGARLAAIRKERGLTQEQLGNGLGTDGANASKSVVYGWEKNQHYPRVDQLMLICKRLNCSADYLLFGEVVVLSPRLKAAQEAVKELTDEERLALFTAIQQPGLPDEAVEELIPVTKTRKGAAGTPIAQFANVQEHKSLIKSHKGGKDGSNHVSGNEDQEDGRSTVPLHGASRKRPGNRSGGGR